MAHAATYSLTTTGEILEGFELQDVVTGFASLCDIAPEKAAAYVDRRKLIRKGLSREEAETYVAELAKIGMSVDVHEGVISRPRQRVQLDAAAPGPNDDSLQPTATMDELPEELLPHEYSMSTRLPVILIGVATVLLSAFVIAYIRTGGLTI